MDTSQMKYFIEVATCLNVTVAAERLFISQPALSRHIASIEAELNAQLFIRNKNRIYLTMAGKLLLERLTNIYSECQTLVAAIHNTSAEEIGTLKLGVLEELIIQESIKTAVSSMMVNYPKLVFPVTYHNFQPLIDMLLSGELDVILTLSLGIANNMQVEYKVLERRPWFLLAKSSHELANLTEIKLRDFPKLLKNENIVSPTPEMAGCVIDGLNKIFKEVSFTPNYKYVPMINMQFLWVCAGIGIALVNDRHAYVKYPDVSMVPIVGMPASEIVMAWSSRTINPYVGILRDAVNEVLD